MPFLLRFGNVRTEINYCLYRAKELHSVVVVMLGPGISVCHKMLCFLARTAICFFGSVIVVVACYKAMQRVTVTKGLNCT